MPEGHTIHRAARLQNTKFSGSIVEATSPQGRFSEGAERIAGTKLSRIHANGKHLFYDFESGDIVHVHLGLFGKFRFQKLPAPEPSPNCRWLMWNETHQLHLAGPTVCEVITPDEMQGIRERLGPDPLAKHAEDPVDKLVERLSRRSIPIGAAIMDQKVMAGIGNVYRAELLFLIGQDPFTPAKDVPREALEQLWSESVRLLTLGEKAGRIVTTEPADVGRSRRSDIKAGERTYCYKRQGQPCRRCGEPIRRADIDGRNIWWCPNHQN